MSVNISSIISQKTSRIYQLLAVLLDHTEPFDATAVTFTFPPAGFKGSGSQSAYFDGSWNESSISSFGETVASPIPSQRGQSGPSEPDLT